jgi:hypothetical protein
LIEIPIYIEKVVEKAVYVDRTVEKIVEKVDNTMIDILKK